MRIIRTEKQKDGLARFFWDLSKLTSGLLVIAPFTDTRAMSAVGMLAATTVTTVLLVSAYTLDGREVRS